MANCRLRGVGTEAKSACGTTQLGEGVEAGIEGSIHVMHVHLEEHKHDKDWGFLLINARSVFYEENWTSMLWAVRHDWPSGAQFTFNYYRHWATLVVQDTGDGSGHFLHSKEGVTQGDHLAMMAYVIGVLPLIRDLRGANPRVTQPWYTGDAGAGGKFPNIMEHTRDLQAPGSARGYYPEPT